jgi:hypothetical protein
LRQKRNVFFLYFTLHLLLRGNFFFKKKKKNKEEIKKKNKYKKLIEKILQLLSIIFFI